MGGSLREFKGGKNTLGYYLKKARKLKGMQQGHIFGCHEFPRCFFGASPCSGTSWFREYTSQISMSNVGFHVEKVTIPAGNV
jgi:hypothetical protein